MLFVQLAAWQLALVRSKKGEKKPRKVKSPSHTPPAARAPLLVPAAYVRTLSSHVVAPSSYYPSNHKREKNKNDDVRRVFLLTLGSRASWPLRQEIWFFLLGQPREASGCAPQARPPRSRRSHGVRLDPDVRCVSCFLSRVGSLS